jgi:hypothetical protein
MSVAGQSLGILLPVERFQNHTAEPLRFIHKRKIPFQVTRSPDRKSQNDSFNAPRSLGPALGKRRRGSAQPEALAALQSMLTVCPKPPIEPPSAAAVNKEQSRAFRQVDQPPGYQSGSRPVVTHPAAVIATNRGI